MTVRQLIEWLEEHDLDKPIFITVFSEGSSYYNVDMQLVEEDNTLCINFYT